MNLHDQKTSEVMGLFELNYYSNVHQLKSGEELKKVRHKKVGDDSEVIKG